MNRLTKNLFLMGVMVILSLCISCQNDPNPESSEKMEFYVRTSLENPRAVFVNSATREESSIISMEKVKDGEMVTYRTFGDPQKYDRVYFMYDSVSTKKTVTFESELFAFNKYINGLELQNAGKAMGFVYDKPVITPTYKTVSLTYDESTGKKKKIFIWTPESYEETDDSVKYSVIYMTDGQNLYNENSTGYGSWAVAQAVTAMMSKSNQKAIIVGIDDSDGNRDSELTPNLGKSREGSEFENGTGKKFAEFVVNTVMSYINENYNVYTDASHTSVCGSSSGGLEAFYIGMTYADKFGGIGALSPAFLIFSSEDWDKYLATLDLSTNQPNIYIYNGQGDDLEKRLYVDALAMYNKLKALNYPTDKMQWMVETKFGHNEKCWRAIFPDFLKYTFK